MRLDGSSDPNSPDDLERPINYCRKIDTRDLMATLDERWRVYRN